jgi:hypothetical protein
MTHFFAFSTDKFYDNIETLFLSDHLNITSVITL